MNQSPISNPVDDEESSTRSFRLAMLGCGFLVFLGLAVFVFLRNQAEYISMYERYFPTPTLTTTPVPTLTATRTFTPTATFTATPNRTATQAAAIATDTALVFESTATGAADQWQPVMNESFDNSNGNWPIDPSDDEYSKTTYEIQDGKYRVTSLSHKGFVQWIPVSIATVEDFSVTIDAALIQNNGDNDCGIAFRIDPNGNFYYFAIDSNNMYSLYKYQSDTWSNLIYPSQTPLIKPGGPNRMSVIAQGDHIVLFINDQFLVDTHDASIKDGTIALTIEMYQPNQTAIFEFDNIELLTP